MIETSHLRLRQLTTDDAPFLFSLMNSETWLTSIGDRGIRMVSDAAAYIREFPEASYRRNGYGLLLVQKKETDTPIGICGLVKRDELPGPDLGFALLPEFESLGLAFESSVAILKYAFSELRLPEVFAITTDDNSRSIRLLSRLGFSYSEKMTDRRGKLFNVYLLRSAEYNNRTY